MRVVVLWKGVTGYVDAEIRALRSAGADVALAVLGASSSQHPQQRSSLDELEHTMLVDATTPPADIASWARAFDPDVVICCGWDPKPFMGAVSLLHDHRSRKVLYTDGQWSGTPKQRAGQLIAPWLLHRRFDAAIVPGEPQARFVRRLGFAAEQIFEGGCVADTDSYTAARLPDDEWRSLPPSLLFCGRLVPEKGLDVLLEAYARYRSTHPSPWGLTVAGTGPLLAQVQARPDIDHVGFVEPTDVPALMARHRALVLPSRFEPWGVVVHEAVCAGLPLVLSDRVGAATRFLHHRTNGFRVDVDSVESLTWAITAMSDWSDDQLERGRRRSIELAEQLGLADFVGAIAAIAAISAT
ncbi:MAG: glycosyltransferase family 4 protein [Ilumatobacteraceae bacterium]